MNNMTKVDNDKRALKFLKLLRPKGYMNLVAIPPMGGSPIGITKEINSPELLDFIKTHNGKSNIYYMVNEPYSTAPNNKLTKDHVAKIHALFIDADPHKDKDFNDERIRLSKLSKELNQQELKPTFIVDSGNGHQALWLLDNAMPVKSTYEGETLDNGNTKGFEEYGRGLAQKYNTDAVQNIDRILRLPFTTNIPTKLKLAKGRKESLATVLYASQKRHNWDNLKNICTPQKAPEYDQVDLSADFANLKQESTWADFPETKQKFIDTMNTDQKLKSLMMKTTTKPSRSEYDFALASILKSNGWDINETATAMWLFPHGKGKELTAREINRSFARADNPLDGMAIEGADEIMKQLLPPEPTIDQNGLPSPIRLKRFSHVDASLITSGLPLVKNLIDENSMSVLYGQSNTGKSFMALDLALHLAMGKNWGEYKIPKKKAIIYVFAEAGGSAGKRILAAKKRLDIINASTKEVPFFYITMGVNFLEKPTKERDDVSDITKMTKQIKAETGYDVGMVVVDTLATTFAGGNENSSEDMGAFITNIKQIQELAKTAVLIVHHSGKDQAAGARGHSSLRAATDTEFEVKSELQGTRYHREMIVKKQRDGETGTKIKFGLNVVELGVDSEGDPITSCSVVLEGDHEFASIIPSQVDSLSPEHKRMYFAVYLASNCGDGHQNLVNAWLDYLIKEKVILEQNIIDQLVIDKPITVGIQADNVCTKRNNIINWRNALLNKNVVSSKVVSMKAGDVTWEIV